MRRVFLSPAHLTSDLITIDGPDFHHLANVLRVRVGDALILLDGEGGAYHAEVVQIEKRSLTGRRVDKADVPPEPAASITVAQALGKGDRFEQVLQHGTEAGASGFIPLVTERTVVRVDAREAAGKLERWRIVAKGAAEQSGRARIPFVEGVATLRDLADRFPDFGHVLMLHPNGQPLSQLAKAMLSPSLPLPFSPPLLLLVGPEGGFSDTEVEQTRARGARIVSLGPYVLRTETAAVVAVSQLLFAVALRDQPL
jgi:16S rRNA (uracil1498-N3)-methyltransferase